MQVSVHRIWKGCFCFCLFLLGFALEAGTLRADLKIPEDLQEWVPWVLQDHEQERCATLQAGPGIKPCVWGSPLVLNLDSSGGSFSQSWKLEAPAWVPLPGELGRWPLEVQVNGQAAPVLERQERPFLFLAAGDYSVGGLFRWSELPESLSIPPATGVLQLVLNGSAVDFPQRSEPGLLGLGHSDGSSGGAASLELAVFRKLTDAIPFRILYHIKLDVSGPPREITLGKIIPEGFIPLELQSELPARLDAQRGLILQLQPGQWTVEWTVRSQGPVSSLTLAEHGEPWPSQEIWVFEAQPELRSVQLEGGVAVDPQQTQLPEGWRQFPAYSLTSGQSLRWVELQRGANFMVPNQLSLYRQWRLDFTGEGLTLLDVITGTLRHSWRLNMEAPVELGHVNLNGQDQLITRLSPQGPSGVEVREGDLQLNAESRIPSPVRHLNAVGWDQDFQQVAGKLLLPPGWRLFSVSGVDEARDTWISQWSLLDLFMVLILALAFGKLWGWPWGGLALLAFGLTFTERDAPYWIWLAVVVGVALWRVLPLGKLKKLMAFYRTLAFLLLLLWALPFLFQQLSVGVFPVLEYSREIAPMDGQLGGGRGRFNAVPEATQLAPSPQDDNYHPEAVPLIEAQQKTSALKKQRIASLSQEQQPGAKVQTGPGMPSWQWNQVELFWHGPVTKTQMLKFYFLSPTVNRILSLLRIVLVLFLLSCVMELRSKLKTGMAKSVRALFVVLVLGGTTFLGSSEARADFPNAEILEQLQARLLKAPECEPQCASLSRMALEVGEQEMQIRLQVSAQVPVAVPLPGSEGEWSPAEVKVLDQDFPTLYRDDSGRIWILLSSGVHQVSLSGKLPDRALLSLVLPMVPQYLETQLEGWSLEGRLPGGRIANTLQLKKLSSTSQALNQFSGAASTQGLLPFVEFTRSFSLGLKWEIHNQLQRVGPSAVPIVVQIPLLPGEALVTPGIVVQEGNALIQLAPEQSNFEYKSVLAESSQISLQASKLSQVFERWQLDLSPVWHADFSGIPPVVMTGIENNWLPQWRPWPGEQVSWKISRPEAVPGSTLTLENSLLEVTPGLRFTEAKLGLTLRSSLGGQHAITLPDGAVLQEVKINGLVQALYLEKRRLNLPIVPGLQKIEITWQTAEGMGALFRSPEINLGLPGVNARQVFHLPRNRWVLWTHGPAVGPVVLFWLVFCLMAVAAWILGRVALSPWRMVSWFLLGIGLSQFPDFPEWAALGVVGWIFALARRREKIQTSTLWFNLRQILLAIYTPLALLVVGISIHQGLLGNPKMRLVGNLSTPAQLRWYQDLSAAVLPQAWVFSVPLFVYRIVMLVWALWAAWAMVRLLRWGWACFISGGLWKPLGIWKGKRTGVAK